MNPAFSSTPSRAISWAPPHRRSPIVEKAGQPLEWSKVRSADHTPVGLRAEGACHKPPRLFYASHREISFLLSKFPPSFGGGFLLYEGARACQGYLLFTHNVCVRDSISKPLMFFRHFHQEDRDES